MVYNSCDSSLRGLGKAGWVDQQEKGEIGGVASGIGIRETLL
jgi:hypothetical protein